MSAAALNLRVDSTASEPLGAAAARGLGTSKTASAQSPLQVRGLEGTLPGSLMFVPELNPTQS